MTEKPNTGLTLLTPVQAARELGVHPSRVRQLISSGRLPASRILDRILIRPQDLDLVRVRARAGRPRRARSA